jgi:hypothetical protein
VGAALAPIRRDSAGISLIEYAPPALERSPIITMDSAPAFVIGGGDLEDDVTSVHLLLFLADGRVAGVEGDPSHRSVRVFDTTGAELRAIGRSGEGPGEFQQIVALARGPGDTLAVTDAALSRITMLHPDAGFLRDQPAKLTGHGVWYGAGGRLADGSWLLQPVSWVVSGAGAHTIGDAPPPVPIGRLAADAPRDGFDSLGVVPGIQPVYVNVRHDAVAMRRFSTTFKIAAWHGGVALIDNHAWRVVCLDELGRVSTVIAIMGPRRPVTATMVDSAVAAEMRRDRSEAEAKGFISRAALEANLRAWPAEDSLPPFEAASVGTDGLLWLTEYRAPGAQQLRVIALAPDGTLVGRLVLPGETRVEAFGAERVLLRTTDADGIVRFEVHRLKLPT